MWCILYSDYPLSLQSKIIILDKYNFFPAFKEENSKGKIGFQKLGLVDTTINGP